MKKKNEIDLRREKLRNLLLKEIDEYQYEVYSNSNNSSETLLNKFNNFKNFNAQKYLNEEEKNNYLNIRKNINNEININNYQNQNIKNISYNNYNNSAEQNISLNRNINDILPNKENGQSNIKNNNQQRNQEQEYYIRNNINQQNNNINIINNKESYKYGNTDIDEELNGYSDYYNKLKIDEFMSKKRIQDDLLNQINQKLNNINKNINDKSYQENLAFQYFQNKNQLKINNGNNQ